jgi:hypothetical protein
MKKIISLCIILTSSLSLTGQVDNCVRTTNNFLFISIGTSVGWTTPKQITGYNIKLGVPTSINRDSRGTLGFDYDNYFVDNNYYKGSTLGYFFNFEAKSFQNNKFWIPINFTHKFGLKNKLINSLKKYNELIIGAGIGCKINYVFSFEITADIRSVKTLSKRNAYITPSARLIYSIFQ